MSNTRSNTTGRDLPNQRIRVHQWFLCVRDAQSVVFCAVFCGSIFVFFPFSFGRCIDLSSVYTFDYPFDIFKTFLPVTSICSHCLLCV